mmetsp:Transcript_28302/g.45862  ORF Transcript_28302/g.45862 Transcript_28302/m.45862 type:complete len:378 (+) Transcript_28302:135-1268(+)|eukprot:CAMPEP_0184662508 /NCGR_PEP_ID=MMETSP0308-20130426/43604_1 /TAXON_ID=38269 /ORGANISM="Gloeochaete witrockiana, Strain SAG 46.84" /LENGTH=377 /DNA_ID=CAMNT_0027104583 /DNA_START=114 /DNA_END=1247 /DNA_ORIENTATION=-
MPPKSKAEEKKKQKVAEDKTFGLKNKNKSSKVQKYIQTVASNTSAKKRGEPDVKQEKKEKKEAELQRKQELALLFKPVVTQPKISAGVDPKSVLCQFFKQGECTKGAKCKFSHDLTVERKAEKINVYADRRDPGEGSSSQANDDNMEDWDIEKLNDVVSRKQTNLNKNLPTEIICKFFLEALELRKYGWFWECPNGGEKCMYRHALPPGYVLKSKEKKKDDEDDEDVLLEDLIEEERKAVQGKTPVTLETFTKWKKDKETRKAAAREAEKKERIATRTSMTGRDLFEYNPELFVDDDDAGDVEDYEREEGASDSGGEESQTGGSNVVDESLFNNDGDAGEDDDEGDEDGQEEEEEDDDEEEPPDNGVEAGPSGSGSK